MPYRSTGALEAPPYQHTDAVWSWVVGRKTPKTFLATLRSGNSHEPLSDILLDFAREAEVASDSSFAAPALLPEVVAELLLWKLVNSCPNLAPTLTSRR